MNAGISTEALELLQKLAQSGELKPEVVIAHAAEEDSPLHAYFTWDNAEAAHKHRLDEARTLIRSVKIEVIVNEITLRAPRYVHDPSAEHNSGYTETLSLRDDADRSRAVIQAELGRAIAHLERANRVAAVLGMQDEMNALIQQATALGARAASVEEEPAPQQSRKAARARPSKQGMAGRGREANG